MYVRIDLKCFYLRTTNLRIDSKYLKNIFVNYNMNNRTLSDDERVFRITRNVSSKKISILREILKVRSPIAYCKIIPIFKVHLENIITFLKISDLLEAGCEVIVLFDDIHHKDIQNIDLKCDYFEKLIRSILEIKNVNTDNLRFVLSSSYHFNENFVSKFYKLANNTNVNKINFYVENKITEIINPILKHLDEDYLNADIQLLDDNIEELPNIKKMIYLITPKLIPMNFNPCLRLTENDNIFSPRYKISSSSKIYLLDNEKRIKKKINKAYCIDVECNPLLTIIKYIILQMRSEIIFLKGKKNRTYKSYEKIEYDFLHKKITPDNMKETVSTFLIELTNQINEKTI